MSKRGIVKLEPDNVPLAKVRTLTLADAFNRSAVTPETNRKKDEVDLTGSDGGSDDEELLNHNFDDFVVMDRHEIVINAEGDSVDIRAPQLTYFKSPEQGFTEHHIFFKCELPSCKVYDKTVIPMRGMFGHLFYEKRFIQFEHELLNGKINAWRVESMKAFAKIRQTGKVMQLAIDQQETFAREKVGHIQKNIGSFEYCHISILNKESITKLLMLEDCQDNHCTEIVYNFCKYNVSQLYVRPGGMSNIDVVTRFDRNPKLDFVFGKPLKDCVKVLILEM